MRKKTELVYFNKGFNQLKISKNISSYFPINRVLPFKIVSLNFLIRNHICSKNPNQKYLLVFFVPF